ncbi:MAG: ATP-binding protein [Phycisphaerae bacterium]|nr:ATP-binding protein [Phycisphaerae bacterium]
MIKRNLSHIIHQSLQHFPAVGLVGARQVGKTTLAKMISKEWSSSSVYLDLERPADHAALLEPERFLDRYASQLVIIDEVQLSPNLFPVLRSLIDRDRHAGRFLLLGSSSPDLMRQSGESLAGRIVYHELAPFALHELPSDHMDSLWLRGGFPDSHLAADDDISAQWRDNFIMTYLQRDLTAMGYDIRLPAMTLRRLWQMLAHSHGHTINLSQLATNLELSRQSIRKILDILNETFMIRQLPPFHTNLKKRLVKTPKVYIRDSGILHSLLGLNTWGDLLGHSIVGMSWEGFCLEQILNRLPTAWNAFFYRTQAHAEIDLVLQKSSGEPPILVEFKHAQAPKLSKGFWSSLHDLQPQASYIVYPGTTAYPSGANIEVLPLTQIETIWHKSQQPPSP